MRALEPVDALAMLDATATPVASLLCKSRSAWYGVILAAEHPERVERLVLLAPALQEAPRGGPDFHTPRPAYEGWQQFNAHHWREHDADFLAFFHAQCFPERHHFEQNIHVPHRLARYGAGVRMEYHQTDPEALAHAIADGLKRPVLYRDVEPDGARRAAATIAELL